MSGAETQFSATYRPRRPHTKSRNGCLVCKNRRVKCDEKQPSCTRCQLAQRPCTYRRAQQPATADGTADILSLPTPTNRTEEPSPGTPLYSRFSPLLDGSSDSNSTCSGLNHGHGDSEATESPLVFSDSDLYHHFLEHTSRTLTYCQRDQGALQIGMPTLALRCEAVFHSILALAAACLCSDMISHDAPDPAAIHQTLLTGYQHHTRALEQMQVLISERKSSNREFLVANSVLLVPFASAFQRINHWISTRASSAPSQKRRLSITPRNFIIFLRGVQTTREALHSDDTTTTSDTVDFSSPWDNVSTFQHIDSQTASAAPSRTHLTFPILAATSQRAFSELQRRLEFVSMTPSKAAWQDDNQSLVSNCIAAFDVLDDIRTHTFSGSESLTPSAMENSSESPSHPRASVPQTASWLLSYLRPAIPSESSGPLTRSFLAFLNLIPQAYLDLLLPLLDQRLENPVEQLSDILKLDGPQALALEIYAHWLVLMFLVEDESWWIGDLAITSLRGIINTYGEEFAHDILPSHGRTREQWWPAGMLKIMLELKQHQ
ncbi:hypothetical protein NA57DRAFT_56859 [Rhizodiscina lignyota]|uniref:Zn(2)-C6 fungal-type domain-containing protein n=1 Tax=Rhizodiscina lignyota TaxID=1504668 RepID=A0A9P4ICV7_9PEZI|nr:hypothetical protein NA57DRAFT_56859 [Rhizodiscina lignyota]